MARRTNTTRSGGAFGNDVVLLVWRKGQVVPGYDPARFRKDACGMWIVFDQYGQTSEFGWEVDHRKPVAKGGTDDLNNLHPLHWRNNRHKSDDYPNWTCLIP